MARAPSDTRQNLIETANELIWLESYNSVSVDDICAKANVKKGSFYHFFPSKADLALATMEYCMQQTIADYDDIFSPRRHPIERLDQMADYLYEKQEKMRIEHGQVCGCPFITLGSELAAKDEAIGEKVRDICAKKLTYYESALRDLIAYKEIDPTTDVKLKAQEIFAFIVGQIILARIKNDLSFIRHSLKSGLRDLVGIQQKVENVAS
ncbi:MAG: TetR family transcriptional regulator [Rhodomicrobium sp.]|nr:MAG: TetR family transcriptional regulator [Rhodomicrobium sp.]